MKKTLLSAVVAMTLFSGTSINADTNTTKINMEEKVKTTTVKQTDEKVIAFSKKIMKKWEAKGLFIESVKILNKAEVEGFPNFTAYILQFEANFKITNKDTKKTLTDIFFVSKGGIVATSIFSLEGENLSAKTKFNLSKEDYYSKDHFAMGSENANIKVIVFSDVFCPFCRKIFPEFKKEVSKNKEKVAIYFIDFPLEETHPASKITSEIIRQSIRLGKKDVREKLYTTDISSIVKETNPKIIADFIEEKTGFKANISELKKDQLAVEKDMDLARKLAIESTPSMVINGKHSSFKKMKELLSKIKTNSNKAENKKR